MHYVLFFNIAKSLSTPSSSVESSAVSSPIPFDISIFLKHLFLCDSRCLIALGPRLLVTYRHSSHKEWNIGDVVQVGRQGEIQKYAATVTNIVEQYDFILLETNQDICDQESPLVQPADGAEYTHIGISLDDKIRWGHGAIQTSDFSQKYFMLGDTGCRRGDSGGPVFNKYKLELFGMIGGSFRFSPNTAVTFNNLIKRVEELEIVSNESSSSCIIPATMFGNFSAKRTFSVFSEYD